MNSRIIKLNRILDKRSLARLKNSAIVAQRVENKWKNKLKNKFKQIESEIIDYLEKYGRLPKNVDFVDFYVEHYFDSYTTGIKTAQTEEYTKKYTKKKLASSDDFSDIKKKYDQWKKKKFIPKKQKKQAEVIEKEYLKKVSSVWEKYSRNFRRGDSGDKSEIIRKIIKAGRTTLPRASTIVQTETTRHYNDARRKVYDKSEDVTHYLFVAIRDAATTKWCNTRDKLIYKKGSDYLEKETPAIHWNCRSEILPLTPLNPVHLRLINNKSRWRENNKPEPLPRGWKRRVA